MAKPKTPKKTPAEDEAVEEAEIVETEEAAESEVLPEAPAEEGGEPDNAAALDDASADEALTETPTPVSDAPRRSGIWPLLLGGVLAAGIGFAAATYLGLRNADDLAAANDAMLRAEERVFTLEASVAALTENFAEQAAEISAIETVIEAELEDRLARLIGDVSAANQALEARLQEVEKRPLSEGGTADPAAVAAYQRELDALRADLDAQRAQNETLQAEFAKLLGAAEDRAGALTAEAEEAARQATARAALLSIRAALESGTGFASSLAALEDAMGQAAPAPLSDAAEAGVQSLSDLQRDFEPAARIALAASPRAGSEGTTSERMLAFLQGQLGARSLEPREGDDPDAVLSRAEAALRGGDLETALAELQALPERGRTAFSDWEMAASARQSALAAADALADTLKSN